MSLNELDKKSLTTITLYNFVNKAITKFLSAQSLPKNVFHRSRFKPHSDELLIFV